MININIASAAEVAFDPKDDYTTGTTPVFVAIGDLNGDGKADLATVNYIPSTVSVFINNGTGAFATKVDYLTGSYPRSVAIGDLNGDGKADLATANYGSNTVSVFINNGAGAFTKQSPDISTGLGPFSVAIGDLSGNGNKADIAVANNGSNTVSVFINNGAGAFTKQSPDISTGTGPRSVAIGDLNGDGKADLATANYNATISVFINNGTGAFTKQSPDISTGTGPYSVAIGDLSGPGKADLAVANSGSNTVSVFINNGTGAFTKQSPDIVTGSNPQSAAIGDLSGDGKADLAVANYNSHFVSVFINTGAGTPGPPTVTAGDGQVKITDWATPSGPAPAGYRLYSSADNFQTKIGVDISAPPTFPIYVGSPTIVNGTSYTLKVSAVDSAGVEGLQSPASAEVTPQYPPLPPSGAPSGTAGSTEVALSWSAPSPASDSTHGPATGYYMYWKPATAPDTSYAKFNTTPITGTSGTVTGLVNGTSYVFKITANNVGGENPLTDSTASPPITPTAPSCEPPLTDNLISWWPGDGDANDIEGLNNGTLSGGAIATASGKVGQAFEFDSFNTYVSHPTNGMNPSAGTVEMWVKPNWSGNDGAIHGLWQTKNDDTTNQANWISLFKYSNPSNLYFRVMTPTAAFTNDLAISAGTVFTAGVWTHIAVTWNSSATKIYINGTERASKATSASLLPTSLDGFARIGRAHYKSFNGLIDEPSVYNRALLAEEIQAIYNIGAGGKCKPAVPPGAPTATAGNGQVAITDWTAPTSGPAPAGYRLYSSADNFQTKIGADITAPPTFPIYVGSPTIANGTSYTFKVSAVDSVGVEGSQSPASSPAVTPQAPPYPPSGAPSGTVGGAGVALSWSPSPASDSTHGPAEGYFMYWKLATDPDTSYAKFNTTPITGTSGTVTGLVNGTSYVFKITANNVGGENPLTDSTASPPITPTAPSCEPPLTDNLISWWPGDGNANDIQPSANNGTLTNGATFADGRIGQAFSLDGDYDRDGVGSYVSVANTTNLKINEGTIEAWIKAPASVYGDGYGYRGIVTKQNAYSLFLVNGVLVSYSWGGGGARSTGVNLADDQWHHVAMTFKSGVTLGTEIYIDGAPSLTTTITVGNQNTGLAIGGAGNPAVQFFEGLIDEPSVYNRALLAEEIQAIYNIGAGGKCKPYSVPPPTSLVATAGDKEVVLGWTAPTETVTGYKVYRGTSPGFVLGTPIATLANTETTYTDTGLVNGTTYYYKVTATNAEVNSNASNEVSATPTIQCLVDVNLISTSQTKVVVSGTTYYIDVDGVRGYIWNNSLITSSTQNTYTYPPGSKLVAGGVLQHKITESGFYDLFIKEDQAARTAWFEGRPVAPDAFDSLFSDRRPQ